jgi:hypothetical protein
VDATESKETAARAATQKRCEELKAAADARRVNELQEEEIEEAADQ